MKEKKTYASPVLIVHGDVEIITQQSDLNNSDSPSGTPNTAYSSV